MGRVQLDRPALQRLQDSAREADDRQRARSGRPLGTPTPVQKATYAAKLGDLVVCVPPAAGQLITLPAIETRDAGRPVTVYNRSGNA